MRSLIPFFKALADESRLRIVRLLLHEPSLNVGELVAILGLAQPSVSQKLAELRRAGFVRERREGGFSYHELIRRPGEASFELLETDLRDAPDDHGDLARLAEVRRDRADHGSSNGKLVEPGRSWVAWARALRFVLPALAVADFGCGDGALTAEIAAWAARVDAVDRDAARLKVARDRIARLGLRNVTFHHGDVETLKLRAASCDLAVVSHLLHHVNQPGAVLAAAARVLKPGGRALILELAPHGESWVQSKLGHLHLGFTAAALEKLLAGGGFGDVVVESAARAAREPFRILIATGVKPEP